MIFKRNNTLTTVTFRYDVNIWDSHSMINFFISVIFLLMLPYVISPMLLTLYRMPRTAKEEVHSSQYLPSEGKLLPLKPPTFAALVLSTLIPSPEMFLNYLKILNSLFYELLITLLERCCVVCIL